MRSDKVYYFCRPRYAVINTYNMNTLIWTLVIYAAFGAFTVNLYHAFSKEQGRHYIFMYVANFLLWPLVWLGVIITSIQQAKRERRNRDKIKQQDQTFFTNISNNLNDYLP